MALWDGDTQEGSTEADAGGKRGVPESVVCQRILKRDFWQGEKGRERFRRQKGLAPYGRKGNWGVCAIESKNSRA